ncbi:MAG: hypothetical protein K2G26_02750 [Clostridia bacterium]|nr:hypothetical protein [Clostridia bacterium]
MEDEIKSEQPAVDLKRKVLLEVKNFLIDLAFPIMLMLVISATILSYASYTDDIAVSLIALIGGEIMLAGALVIFGRANGSTAYNKTMLNAQKRELGSTDEKVICRTGEYAIWKGVLIGFILCVPFIIFQIIELCVHNVVTSFCLQYMCGWAYFPYFYFGAGYQAFSFIMIVLPVGAHTLGYYLGKLKRLKAKEYEETDTKGKRRRK